MGIGKAGDANWQKAVLEDGRPVLVEFIRDTCPVCAAMAPVVEELAATFEGQVPVYRVDVDEEPDLVWAYEVMSTPTFIVFRDGEPLQAMGGSVGQAVLEAMLEDALGGGGAADQR